MPARSLLASLLVAALVVGALTMAAPSAQPDVSDLEHFKYGSFGAEENDGLPYWIWQALPHVCGDTLRGQGFGALGIVWEPGRELPVGFSKRRAFGGDRIAVNCAFCHTATWRPAPGEPARLVFGGPATRTSPQAYFRFVQDCVGSDRFTADAVLAAVDRMTTLGWTERLTLRFVTVGATRKGVARRGAQMAWSTQQPAWGPGRVDPFNPVKFVLLGQPADPTIGASDMMPLWDMAARDGRPMHWDGVNTSLHALMVSSGLANGASARSLDASSLARVERWMRTAPVPRFPLAVSPSAGRGAAIFARECAGCHAPDGPRAHQVVPIEEVGTDQHRLDSFTPALAAAFNGTPAGPEGSVSGFRKSGGYVAVPLTGIWLRAPYLHNGSVPTLAALLSPPAERPARFVRGYDVIDPVNVGFVSDGPDAARTGFVFDTALPGNGNGGHPFGTTLGSDDRAALIEFLKTL